MDRQKKSIENSAKSVIVVMVVEFKPGKEWSHEQREVEMKN
jgi:hypothetical protein